MRDFSITQMLFLQVYFQLLDFCSGATSFPCQHNMKIAVLLDDQTLSQTFPSAIQNVSLEHDVVVTGNHMKSLLYESG